MAAAEVDVLQLADAVEHTAAFGVVERDAAGVDAAWRWVRRTADLGPVALLAAQEVGAWQVVGAPGRTTSSACLLYTSPSPRDRG